MEKDLTQEAITQMELTQETIEWFMGQQEKMAWESLARYKFLMFGYHAATWVNLNKLLGDRYPDPFVELVRHGKKML